MNKVYCRYCGRQIDEDATFCTYCGKKQNVSKKPSLNVDGIKTTGKTLKKVLALVCIPVDYVRTIKIPRMSVERANLWRKRMKRIGKVLLVIAFIAIIVTAGAWGYSYYYNDYLPEKRLNDACEDLVKKFQSNDKAISLEYCR